MTDCETLFNGEYGMEYIITILNGNDRRVVSRHDNLDDAIKAGKSAYEKSNRGEVVSCITGKINDDGRIEGQYRLIDSWF